MTVNIQKENVRLQFKHEEPRQESILVPVDGIHILHVRRIYCNPDGTPVLLFHGTVENGTIFYSKTNKGLAPFLARHGYDVYVADHRGHGLGTPPIDGNSSYGQNEAITEDIPALAEEIIRRKGAVRQVWMAHSWGGVLLQSALARHEKYRALVRACIYFGTKRHISVKNFAKFIQIDFFWAFLARLIIWKYGYLPMKDLGLFLGDDDETDKTSRDINAWVRSKEWIDCDDGFDYGRAARGSAMPPARFIAATKDPCLGNPKDVRLFIDECGQDNAELKMIGRRHGTMHDYNHITMLTHKDAVNDHFPEIARWLEDIK